ncbi:hypothetical protein BSKO_06501 [Bryopsis sp. KO-2023]|nr:hypothetical protein BSKO_06501 [Bryopsis sp. KO-2023]
MVLPITTHPSRGLLVPCQSHLTYARGPWAQKARPCDVTCFELPLREGLGIVWDLRCDFLDRKKASASGTVISVKVWASPGFCDVTYCALFVRLTPQLAPSLERTFPERIWLRNHVTLGKREGYKRPTDNRVFTLYPKTGGQICTTNPDLYYKASLRLGRSNNMKVGGMHACVRESNTVSPAYLYHNRQRLDLLHKGRIMNFKKGSVGLILLVKLNSIQFVESFCLSCSIVSVYFSRPIERRK